MAEQEPIAAKNAGQIYKKAKASFWTVEEIDLSKDFGDWENENLIKRFGSEAQAA